MEGNENSAKTRREYLLDVACGLLLLMGVLLLATRVERLRTRVPITEVAPEKLTSRYRAVVAVDEPWHDTALQRLAPPGNWWKSNASEGVYLAWKDRTVIVEGPGAALSRGGELLRPGERIAMRNDTCQVTGTIIGLTRAGD